MKNTADMLVVIILAIIVASVLNSAVFETEFIMQSSMSDTLYGGEDPSVPCDTAFDSFFYGPQRGSGFGDKVLVFKTKNVKAGDIVIVRKRKPDGTPSGTKIVKRVIACGGDVVDIREGKTFVNGAPLDEPYVTGETEQSMYYRTVSYPYTVPDGGLFVMGDNRGNSSDSRDYGAVERKDVVGKVVLVIQKKTKKLVPVKKLA